MKKRIITILLCIITVVLIFVAFNYQNTSSKRPQNYTELSQIQSTIDKDNDGIDDQTDILENAFAYVDTHPKYKSKYYETGYPDDHYGVCTDVVAFALKNSGYDLQILLEKDINEHPENYDIDESDSNIDFRRVKICMYIFRTIQLI